MTKDRRWMTSVVKEAAKAKIAMPWARGAQRDAMIARRKAQEAKETTKANGQAG